MKYIHIIIGVLIIFSCSENNDKKGQLIIVENIESQEDINLEEIVSETNILLLKFPENDILGIIKDLCFIDNHIYILDDLSASIFIFDLDNGNFIKRISKRGNGQGEYISPIALESGSSYIYLLDMPTNNIICYDKELNAINTIRLPFAASDFICTKDGFILHSLDDLLGSYKFIVVDKKGEVLHRFIQYSSLNNAGLYNWGPGRHFSKNNDDEIFFSEIFSNKVYSFNNSSHDFTLKFNIDFVGKNIPDKTNVNNINVFEQTQYAVNVNFFVLPNTFITSFIKENKRYYTFVDFETKKQQTGIVRDKTNNLPFFPQWQYQNKLVGMCHYEDIKELNKNSDISNQNDIEDENLVLLFYSIKQ
jgi:hypothetical protein